MESKKIVIFKSNTGFTEKYAKWIAEELGCEDISIDRIKVADLEKYEMIIFGGGIHAGMINGLNFIKKNIDFFKSRKTIIYGTGMEPSTQQHKEELVKQNLSELGEIPFFYFRSGLNYERMHFFEKLIMNFLKFGLKNKKDRNEYEEGMYKEIQGSADYAKRENIRELVDFAK